MASKNDKKKMSEISTGYNLVWFIYTLHYIVLFSIISSDEFSIISVRHAWGNIIALNIIMNTIALVLAVIGVIIAHKASKKDSRYWSTLNFFIHVLMIFWIFGGSLWILFLLT